MFREKDVPNICLKEFWDRKLKPSAMAVFFPQYFDENEPSKQEIAARTLNFILKGFVSLWFSVIFHPHDIACAFNQNYHFMGILCNYQSKQENKRNMSQSADATY